MMRAWQKDSAPPDDAAIDEDRRARPASPRPSTRSTSWPASPGVPSRTIRFYQSKGTLPSPRRQGRVALYGQEHVERLKLIAELQDRGLRLDAIRDVLVRARVGRRLAAELARASASGCRRPWSDERPLVLTSAELKKRFAGQPARADRRPRAGRA